MNILFIGGGNMAAAIIGGLIAKDWPAAAIHAVDVLPEALKRLEQQFGIRTSGDGAAAARNADCIVLAVKPQQLRDVARSLAPAIAGKLVISIAAGIRGIDLARWLGPAARIVRAMPNTPALVSAGITGLHAMPGVSDTQKQDAERILAAVGTTFWVGSERDLDAVTAVSGSGPAYAFYLIEAMQDAAIALGFDAAAARLLSVETVLGAARLAEASDDTAAVLRERVTSKGGTTERALSVMESRGVKQSMVDAMLAAEARSRELGDALGSA
jgi:pyrroline-5-carboxylate reductase